MSRATRISVAVGFGVALCGAVALYEFGWSPAATATVTLSGQTIEIRYSAPSVRGRQIFGAGGLLSKDPTYPAWRAGANAATTMSTTGDLRVNGLTVPAGTYTLYIWVEDPNAWELIVSRQTGQWGRTYEPGRDLGRVRMTMSSAVLAGRDAEVLVDRQERRHGRTASGVGAPRRNGLARDAMRHVSLWRHSCKPADVQQARAGTLR